PPHSITSSQHHLLTTRRSRCPFTLLHNPCSGDPSVRRTLGLCDSSNNWTLCELVWVWWCLCGVALRGHVCVCVCVCVCVRSKRASKACWASCLPPFTLTTRRPSLTPAHPLIMGCLPCALSSGPQYTGHQASPWQHQSRAQEGRKSKEKGVCVCMSVCVCRGD